MSRDSKGSPSPVSDRMRIFLYEFITGGGCYSWPQSPAPHGSLLAEGQAMRNAVGEDLTAAGHEVVCLCDRRIAPAPQSFSGAASPWLVVDADSERRLFHKAAASAERVMVIAPETDGALLERSRWAQDAKARLVSPAPTFIQLCADKQRCCDILAADGVSVPQRFSAAAPHAGPWPVIAKPNDGCGSVDVQWLHSVPEAHRAALAGLRVEHPVWGWPVSVAVLCGPAGLAALPACEQHLGADLGYLGGAMPLDEPHWSERAERLAVRAVASLSAAAGGVVGYVGVDLIISDAGASVIEINPRLTTSYVGLSRYFAQTGQGRLVEQLLAMVDGLPAACGAPVRAVDGIRWTSSGYWEPRRRGAWGRG